jgi:hypothetical protein
METATQSEWLRAATGGASAVDREKAIIHGVILAEEGPFKSEGRGEFDRKAIRQIVSLAKSKSSGLKSRFAHPNLSDDGIGKFLGRFHDVKSDTVLREAGTDSDGKPLMREVLVARGDLYLDKTALDEPIGGGKPLGVYVMDLAESDPEAFGTSLVLQTEQEHRLDKQGRPLKDDAGKELPPLWRPTCLHASDIVDTGDATNSFLSSSTVDGLPDALVRQGCEMLNQQFNGKPREFVESRLSAFVQRYLNHRYGVEPDTEEPPAPVAPSADGVMLDIYIATELD